MAAEHMIVDSGTIQIYRLFDVGAKIDIPQATKFLEGQSLPFATIRKRHRMLLINQRPLHVILPRFQQDINGQTFAVEPSAKIWSFGAISLRFELEINAATTMPSLTVVSHFFETDAPFHQEAINRVKQLMDILSTAIADPWLWPEYEDYVIFNIHKARGLSPDLAEAFTGDAITALILGEKLQSFSKDLNESLRRSTVQYSTGDLVLLHWNGALVYDPEDAIDITETIEYALCQLLEMRFYDDFLTEQLNTLYQSIENPKSYLLKSPYEELAKSAALQYIDIAEVVDQVNNSFKVLGDFYYAQIYRLATEQLRVHVWRQSVSSKLENLAEFSKLFRGQVNERRTLFLEVLIVVFFAIEIVPLVWSWFK